MKNEKHIELIAGYLQGTLTESERQDLDRLIEQGKIDRKEIRRIESLYQQVGFIETPEPEASLGNRFYSMLEEEKQRQEIAWGNKLSVWLEETLSQFKLRHLAYAVSIFLLGLLAGDLYAPITQQDKQIQQLSSQVHQMREIMMISLLDESSPIERLKAVNISNEIQSVDDRIVEALLRTLNNDSNVNVRIAAVNALTRHASNSGVRKGLINSITRQESPVVQAALADAMLSLQEKQSVDEFKKLLKQEELDSNVRNKLENTIAALN